MDNQNQQRDFQTEFRKRLTSYLTAAFGLVAGLAWNDAVRSLIESIYPAASSGSVVAKFVYATILTAGLVFVTIYLVKLIKRN